MPGDASKDAPLAATATYAKPEQFETFRRHLDAAWTSPGAIPKRLATMRANIKRYVLPPRRPKRVYPRAVKIKMSNYDRKRPRVETVKQ